MKASELSCKDFMVGDWVIPHVYDSKLEPSKIVGIHYNSCKGKDYVDWVDCEAWDELSLSDIEPIPLTAEILEKNGFKKCAGNEWSVFKYEDDDYTKKALYQVLWSADELYLDIASYTSITGEFKRLGVEFVHELQHAMCICGIDKTIEL